MLAIAKIVMMPMWIAKVIVEVTWAHLEFAIDNRYMGMLCKFPYDVVDMGQQVVERLWSHY